MLTDTKLPASPESERMILGAVMLDESLWVDVAGGMAPDDCSDNRNRLIFEAMARLNGAGEHIDRITVFHELQRTGKAEACDGLGYLISLDNDLPRLPHVDSYVRTVREKAELRRVMFRCQSLMDRASTERESSGTLLSEMAAVGLESDDRDGHTQTVGEVIEEAGGLDAYFQQSGRDGLKTGFGKLDQMTCGLGAGDLFIVAARPSMGKTALVMNVAAHVAINGQHVAVFSLEMSARKLTTRLLSSTSEVPAWKIKHQRVDRQDRQRIAEVAGIFRDRIHIWDRPVRDAAEIHSKAQRIQARHGLALVVVDYLQLIAGAKGENRNQEISVISRGLKLMAQSLGVPVIALSQLSRAVEQRQGDHRPQLSDLRDSGSIEQDADLVAFIFREEVYKPERGDLAGLAELIIAKQRDGPVGTAPLIWRKEWLRFYDRDAEACEEMPVAGPHEPQDESEAGEWQRRAGERETRA